MFILLHFQKHLVQKVVNKLNLTNDEMATILLTSHIALQDKEIKPFTLTHWNKFVAKLINSKLNTPGKLLESSSEEIQNLLDLTVEEINRVEHLLGRGALLAIELENLSNKGIRVLTRSSEHYPKLLKAKLKKMAPPVIFYCGNIELVNKQGIAIVGSRDVSDESAEHTMNVSKAAVQQGYIVYSGGAKGVDSISENEAYNQGGEYVSFLADSLESKIKKKEIRERLASNRILLLTANKPDVGFSVGSAMNRNKYVYALSQCTFIINSDYNKGGTWEGAIDNLKKGWSKSAVIDSKSKGNQALISKGCIAIKETNHLNITQLLTQESITSPATKQINLFNS